MMKSHLFSNEQSHSLRLLSPLVPNPMTNPQILPKQILRKIIKLDILRPQPIRRRYPTHTRHLMHINQRPTPRKERVFLAIQEHHTRNDADVVLPSMTELVPPFAFDDFVGIDLIDGPEVGVAVVEEDGLENVVVVGDGGLIGVVIHPELVLVICAVKGHFDFLHVFGVGVRVVHRSETGWFSTWAFAFVLGKSDLFFLLFVLWFGA